MSAEAYKTYFFQYINREVGGPANDWKQVLESLPQQGFYVNPKPGQVTPSSPHHGISIMIDAGGNARGRIWLPTDTYVENDGNRWYTHEFQVIADGPTPGSFVWAWQDKGGAPVRPFDPVVQPPINPIPPVVVPPTQCNCEAKLRDLQEQIDRLDSLMVMTADALVRTNEKFGKLIAVGNTKSRTGPFGLGSHFHEAEIPVLIKE
jgi:hypothetical protein